MMRINNRVNAQRRWWTSSLHGVNKFIDKKSGELSSGQKNRVSLAKSLINKPKILFLDEPTASLDPDIGDFVRNYITEYKKHI